MSPSARSSLTEAEIWGAESSTLEGEAFVITDLPSCRGFGRVGVLEKGFGWKMFEFCGVQFEASIIQPSLETRTGGLSGRSPFRRPQKESSQVEAGGLRLCSTPQRWIPSRPRAKNSGPKGSPCCTSLLLGILSGPNKTKLPSTIRVARITVLGQAGGCSSDFAKKTGTVNLVESTPQIHGQQAPFFQSLSCFCLDNGFTNVVCSRAVSSLESVSYGHPAFQETT